MIKQLTFLGLLWILISNSLATTQEEERAWWISMEGWQSHRGDPNYTALNAILNTSAGEYTHLRGGHRTDEPREFEIGGALGYHFWSRFNLSSRLTYLRIETAGYFVDMSREYTMKWTTQATIPSFRLEFYLPIAEAKSIRTKLFIGFDYYFLTTQIQSKPYIEQILDTRARGGDLGYHTGGGVEIRVFSKLSLLLDTTFWYATITPIKANSQTLKMSDFRHESDDDLMLHLDGNSYQIGLRYYF